MKSGFVPRSETTRQFIVEQAAGIFNKKGYAGTSLSDLTTATQLTKGSIYGNFENKNEVAVEAFKHNFKELGVRITTFVSKVTNPIDQLLAITHFYRQDFDLMKYLGGCPVMNAAIDSDDTNEHLRKEVAQAVEGIIGIFSGIIESGKKLKQISQTVTPAKYGVLFFAMIEGGILLSKTTNKKQYLYETCDRIDQIIRTELTG